MRADEAVGAPGTAGHVAIGLVEDATDAVAVEAAQQLAERIRWFSEHREAIPAMRAASRESAAAWQWTDYKAAIAKVVGERMQRG